jgi:hypothetical protein
LALARNCGVNYGCGRIFGLLMGSQMIALNSLSQIIEMVLSQTATDQQDWRIVRKQQPLALQNFHCFTKAHVSQAQVSYRRLS